MLERHPRQSIPTNAVLRRTFRTVPGSITEVEETRNPPEIPVRSPISMADHE